MDIQVVAIGLEDSRKNSTFTSSGILLGGKFVITTHSMALLYLADINKIYLDEFEATNSLLFPDDFKTPGQAYVYARNGPDDRFITRMPQPLLVYKSKLIESTANRSLKDWKIDDPNFPPDLQSALSLFLVYQISDQRISTPEEFFSDLWAMWLCHLQDIRLNMGDEIFIKSAPFGNKILLDCCTRGIVSCVLSEQLLLSDCPTTPGSEGGAVYKLNTETPVGVVLSSASWWRNEFTGLTIFADIRAFYPDLLTPRVKHISDSCNARQIMNSTVVQVNSGPNWGTGVVVDATEGIILTNSHVIQKSCDNVKIYWKSHCWPARLLYKVPDGHVFDLAVLKCDSQLHNIKISDENTAKLNDEVYAIGFPFALGVTGSSTITKGFVQKITDSMIITSTCVNPGMSGGAIFNRDGDLIAIIVSNTKYGDESKAFPRFNMAIPYSSIKPAIEVYLKCKDIKTLEAIWCRDSKRKLIWLNFESKL